MMGYGYDMGAGGWVAMTIFWVAVVTLIIWAVSRSTGTAVSGGADPDLRRGVAHDGVTGPAEDILNRRFAAGEVDEETYHSMLATLRSPRTESR